MAAESSVGHLFNSMSPRRSHLTAWLEQLVNACREVLGCYPWPYTGDHPGKTGTRWDPGPALARWRLRARGTVQGLSAMATKDGALTGNPRKHQTANLGSPPARVTAWTGEESYRGL